MANRLLKTMLVLGGILAVFPAYLFVASGYDPMSLVISIPETLVILAFIVGPVTALLYYSEHRD